MHKSNAVSKSAPRIVGIVCNGGTLDVSAVQNWAQKYPEIEHLIIYPAELKSSNPLENSPEVEIVETHDGKEEICQTIREVLKECPHQITEDDISNHLIHKVEPDLLIIVGGHRLPDVLIWQSVYAELFFTKVPLRKKSFNSAISDYKKRNRKFGK